MSDSKRLLGGVRAAWLRAVLAAGFAAAAVSWALGRHGVAIGASVPDVSWAWLVLITAAGLFLSPPARGRTVSLAWGLAATALGVALWSPAAEVRPPSKSLTVTHRPPDGELVSRRVTVPALSFEGRRRLNELSGRRRVARLEISGFLVVPRAGRYRFESACNGRCALRIGNELVANGTGRTEIELAEGVHRLRLRYERGGGTPFLKLSWDRPELFEVLPLDYYVGDDLASLSNEARRRTERRVWSNVAADTLAWTFLFGAVGIIGGRARASGSIRPLVSALALNVPFVLFHPGDVLLDSELWRSLAVNVVLFLAPGLPLTALVFGRERRTLGLVWTLAFSFLVFVGVLALFAVTGRELQGGAAWNVTWSLTNLGLAIGLVTGRAWTLPSAGVKRVWLVGAIGFAAAYVLYLSAATRVVPALEDHDLEVQGTGYGLLTRFEPLLLTDRGTFYYFAHPTLLHFAVGGSFLYLDRLDELRVYDEATRRALARKGDTSVQRAELDAVYDAYHSRPKKLATRLPNVFLAAATVALLASWGARTSAWWLGALAALAYMTSPEVFVRSSYGGYFAISNFFVLVTLLAYAGWSEERSRYLAATCFVAAALLAQANHKLVLLPVAVFVWEMVRGRARSVVRNPLLLGFGFGYAAFWAHGLAVDFDAFWLDHVRTHLADRLAHHNPLGYGGYPSRAGLWLELSRHTGYLLVPTGLLALIGGARRGENAETFRLWLVWFAVTASVFTLVDWRMTKHLMPLMVPLHLAPAMWAGTSRMRVVWIALVFALLCAWNAVADYGIVWDFGAFTIHPMW